MIPTTTEYGEATNVEQTVKHGTKISIRSDNAEVSVLTNEVTVEQRSDYAHIGDRRNS